MLFLYSPDLRTIDEVDGFLATLLICLFFSVVNAVVEVYAFSVIHMCRYRGGRCLFSNPSSSSALHFHEGSRVALVCVPMCSYVNGQY